MTRIVRVLPSVIYMAAIFYFSSLPGPQLPLPPGADDRILHFLGYLGLGSTLVLSATAFARGGLTGRHFVAAAAIGVLYGISDEWHQSFVPQRNATLADVGFDTAGVLTAVLIVRALRT